MAIKLLVSFKEREKYLKDYVNEISTSSCADKSAYIKSLIKKDYDEKHDINSNNKENNDVNKDKLNNQKPKLLDLDF